MLKLRLGLLTAALLLPLASMGASNGAALDSANNDVSNTASLQRGAAYYVNYCLGCHSAQYVRYNRLADDLGLSESQVINNLMVTGERPFDTMQAAMPRSDSESWFGQPPPDLSLIARARSTDYLYTFLRSFYVDEGSPLGTNNRVLSSPAMPNVLWELQGLQRAVYTEEERADGSVLEVFDGFEIVQPGRLSPEEFDRVARDIVNFLDYIGEPVQLQRQSLGLRVIGFLLIFLLFAWLLKREIWKDVK